VIDPNGEAHSLARRIEGAKAKDIRARMGDIDAASLPRVEEARAAMRERQPKEPPREAARQGRQRGKEFGRGQGAEAPRRGLACEERALTSSPKKAPEAKATPPPETDARAQLRRELDRGSLCRRFVFQFSVMAQPKPKPKARRLIKKKRRGRRHRYGGRREPRLLVRRPLGGDGWRPRPINARKLGLVAVKHQQQQAERTEQQGRAFVALAHVVADAGGGGWPEQMTRDLRACRTPQERNAWEQKWGGYLSGQAQREKRGAPERPRGSSRTTDGGLKPS